ncbi:diphosphomevalonate decarboxylase [Onthophagus taurus]|uniref:diphosphomevalonate decarboxylase n=1 Tax=Onthophagus taurus TaxID=166361 RepID=UPI0039BDFA26
MKVVTCIAPVNIAVIKYWGKRNEELILPINDSISTTLDTEQMCAKTTIMANPNFKENKFWLNGKEENCDNIRMQSCLKEIRKKANKNLKWFDWKIHICSENNFPTAAGLASSAAGYACLVFTLAKLYEIDGEISDVARRGSGSACRSIYGGWVRWHMGENEFGFDSIAKEIVPKSHWPEIRVIILVVNDSRKKYSSTSGMKTSVKTSSLLQYRAESIVPKRINEMIDAIKSKNFEKFAEITMKDSNQFHATCLDTYPPCVYMNDVSHSICSLVHSYNEIKKSIEVGYTFDAGPNACLYTLEKNVSEVISLINYVYPSSTPKEEYFRGIPFEDLSQNISEDLQGKVMNQRMEMDQLKYIIQTKVGSGPKMLEDESEHLLNEMGNPKVLIKTII